MFVDGQFRKMYNDEWVETSKKGCEMSVAARRGVSHDINTGSITLLDRLIQERCELLWKHMSCVQLQSLDTFELFRSESGASFSLASFGYIAESSMEGYGVNDLKMQGAFWKGRTSIRGDERHYIIVGLNPLNHLIACRVFVKTDRYGVHLSRVDLRRVQPAMLLAEYGYTREQLLHDLEIVCSGWFRQAQERLRAIEGLMQRISEQDFRRGST